MSDDWWQLTYTSADRNDFTSGGWGVKESSPGTPAVVGEALRSGVVTRIEEVVATSQFASAAELAARPRRLLGSIIEPDGVGLWHSAAAGPDATGRPGNVFTHAAALLDPSPNLRPIDYWRSPDWLAPFGVPEVNAAKLGALRPGAAVSREAVIDFVIAGDNRFDAEWLLAAAAHIRDENHTLVVVTETADVAASWIGVISHLTSAAHARSLRWVTYERANNLPKLIVSDRVDVVCVPPEDLDELLMAARDVAAGPNGQHFLVVDPASWDLTPSAGGAWTAEGQTWPAEARWQNALLDVLSLDRDAIMRVLATMDELCERLTPTISTGVPLHWPLSMAMLLTRSPVSDRDALEEECLALIPPTLLQHPLLDGYADRLAGRRAQRLVGSVPVSTARAEPDAVASLAPVAPVTPVAAPAPVSRTLRRPLFTSDEQSADEGDEPPFDPPSPLSAPPTEARFEAMTWRALGRGWVLGDLIDEREPLPPPVLADVAENPGRWVELVVGMLSIDDDIVERLFRACLNRQVNGVMPWSVLAQIHSGDTAIGWAAVVKAWPYMVQGRKKAIRESPYVRGHWGQDDKWAKRLHQLREGGESS